tara:strand:+ start:1162 stop:1398 length:237 start_codon:yes stop_codon:yes gene_type:complete
MAETQSDMVRLGGLWKQTSNSGTDYLSGSFGNAKMMVFKNTNKEEGSNQPDYNIVMANKQKPEEGSSTTKEATATGSF